MSSLPGAPDAVWVNGVAGAAVSALDRGLHYGDGLFETLACVGGRPRFLELHLKRLSAGCQRLALPLPEAAQLAAELTRAAAGTPHAILKLLLTRGAALERGYAFTGEEKPTRILLRYAWAGTDARASEEGVRARIARLRLGENAALAGIKHLNRLEQVLARAECGDPQIAEALLFSASGDLICGTMSNVFLVRGGRLLTPLLERCGVAGVMREVVGGLAARCGIDFAEQTLDLEHLLQAREIFLTNALNGIRPIRELDGRALSVGPVTRQLQQALAPLLTGASEYADG